MSRSLSENPRRLLVFAPAGDPSLARQQALLSGEEEGISDRDLLVEHLTGGEAAELRRGYGIAAERFEALLLGRDGGVKLRSRRPISPDELFERIDQMPMGQREMRERRDA